MDPPRKKGPFALLTVNTAPDRAKKLIGRMVDALHDRYDIRHLDNCAAIDEVGPKVRQHQPNVLVGGRLPRSRWDE